MRRTPGLIVVSIISLGMMSGLLLNHLQYIGKFTNLAVCYCLMFVHLALKMVASLAAAPHVAAPGADLDALIVDVVVPIYNEDPALLAAGITSMSRQHRKPRTVWLIDDGSQHDGTPVHVLSDHRVVAAVELATAVGIRVVCHRQHNQGKRFALAAAFSRSNADIFVTVDSDTYLQDDCLAQLLVPFGRSEVMSVGGCAYGQNVTRSLLTRAVDLGFVMSFIQGRVAEGYFGSVRVNCGIVAAYRADVVRPNLERFLHQRFMGGHVRAGDDRALTFFAKEKGRSEFQPTAIAYSALPENLGHLARQRMRWARSWCWGSLWLLRRPVLSADFIFTATQCLGILAYGVTMTSAVVGVLSGAVSVELLAHSVLAAVAIGYVVHLRYVLVARQEQPLRQRLLTWSLSPLTSGLYLFLFLPLYFRALAQPAPRAWGTRERIEVGLFVDADADAETDPVPASPIASEPSPAPLIPPAGRRAVA